MTGGEALLDPLLFRRILGRFATGVTVVTTGTPEAPVGMTANAFTSVSLDPPLVLVCVGRSREIHEPMRRAGRFGVSILGESQLELSHYFARRRESLPDGLLRFRAGATGVPLVEGALAHLECRVVAIHPGGDHSIFVARVEQANAGADGPPLIFFGGQYRRLHP